MARRRLGNTESHSLYERRGACRRYMCLRSFGWSVLLHTLVVTAAADLFAQENVSSTTTSAPVEFTIPAQPLGSALNAFAEATGWQVSVPSELIASKTSPGITGIHQPEEALHSLLTGSGVTYRLTAANAVTLVPGAVSQLTPDTQPVPVEPMGRASADVVDSKPVKVPEIVVKEARRRENQAYTVEEVSSATRIPVPVHDTPRSVEVVTKQVLEDQKVIRFSDALRNVSGVSQFSTQGGQAGSFMIRGFVSDLNVF